MLRKLRILIAVLTFSLLTLTLLGVIRMAWLAQVQLIPALLAVNAGVLLFWVLLTLLTGRIYCSVLCPTGILQDLIDRLSRLFRPRKVNAYSRPKNILRYAVLTVTVVCYATGFLYIPALLDPYSTYARMVGHLLRPLWVPLKNWVAGFNELTGWYVLREEFLAQSWIAAGVAFLMLLWIGLGAWLWGRSYCNTFCPVGTLLGSLGRYSLLKVRIDRTRCQQCGTCAGRCKSSCMDMKNGRIDYSRCVVCFDCLERCPNSALRFGLRRKESVSVLAGETSAPVVKEENIDESRRRFLVTASGVLAAGSAALAQTGIIYETTSGERWEKKIRTTMDGRVAAERFWAIMPPCTVSRQRFHSLCTSCHLCITHCPSDILKPAVREYGWEGVLRPTVSYENGWCRPDCNICGQVCPTGAIRPLPVEKKREDKLGWANFNSKTCITQTDDVECGNCARHCPHKAITLVEKNGHKVPQVMVSRCTGCGACEYYCPARPKAIWVEGLMY